MSAWLGWLFFGVALLLVEMLTPGLNIIFFGLAAFVVALLTWMLGLGTMWQWLLFSVFSIALLVLLRKTFKKMLVGDKKVAASVEDDFVGESATVVEPILPNHAGRVECRGCTWTATADEEIPAGTTVRVCSKANITLVVKRV